jgi:hypothetical protein
MTIWLFNGEINAGKGVKPPSDISTAAFCHVDFNCRSDARAPRDIGIAEKKRKLFGP